MARDFVYFDLETQKSANDVGGWGRKDLMKMSIGVTYSTKLGAYRIFGENDADDLVDQLRRADLVIGFNHIYFDYEVLQAYTVLNLKEEIPSFDLMVDLEEKIGHRPKLEAVAQPTLGVGKTAEGTQAIRWWREGKILEIARYCAFDVKVTKEVHEYGAEYGLVRYTNRFKQLQEVTVEWPVP
ncbi:MAG: ribonuclease H-like domain-containing protein [Verrucomicrobiales bacterium]|nr:ribonuclease H-like domain-containing protein [Verrucomicrobiales bacterium]